MQEPNWGEERSSGPRRGRWSKSEVARLKELYGLRDEASIARELGRSVASVRSMAESVFQTEPRSGPWQDAEVAELRKYLGGTTRPILARILGRTEEEIEAKLDELRANLSNSRWTQTEVSELKRLYGTRTDDDLSAIFGRSIESIQRLALKLCIAKDKAFLRRISGGDEPTKMPRWGREELDLLRELYPGHSNLDIAQRLGRSVKSVVSKAHNMGLKKDPARLREMGRENVSLRYRRKQ